MQRKLRVLSYANKDGGYVDVLRASAERYGYELVIIGHGQTWHGFGGRLISLRNFLQQANLLPNEIILWVDAWDVMFVQKAELLLYKYRFLFSDKIVLNAERRHPCKHIHRRLWERKYGVWEHESKTPYFVFNAGMWMGPVHLILKHLQTLGPIDVRCDDQKLLIEYYKQSEVFRADLRLDTDAQLFTILSCWSPDDIIISPDKIAMNQITKTLPFVLHAPAGSDLSSIISKLGFHTRYRTPTKIRVKNWAARHFHHPEVWVIASLILLFLLILF